MRRYVPALGRLEGTIEKQAEERTRIGNTPTCDVCGDQHNEDNSCTGPIECSDCNHKVHSEDPYYGSPCGTFCSECMHTHAKACEVCRDEFELDESESGSDSEPVSQ